MEMAKEHMRYTDIIRWKLAEKVMNRKTYGILYPASLCIERVTSQGDWFWAFTPEMDEDGCADFSKLEEAGKCQALAVRSWTPIFVAYPYYGTSDQRELKTKSRLLNAGKLLIVREKVTP